MEYEEIEFAHDSSNEGSSSSAPPLPARPTTQPPPSQLVPPPNLPPRPKSTTALKKSIPLSNEHQAALAKLRRNVIGQRAISSCQTKNIHVWCLTWNVNGKNVPGDEDTDLTAWLRTKQQESNCTLPEIIAIGAQEMVDLSVVNVATDAWKAAKRADSWREMLEFSLSQVFAMATYEVIAQRHLVGVFLCIFKLISCECSEVASCVAGCGVMGMLGNKGGVSVRMRFEDTTICFVCAHMAAHRENVAGRNADFRAILAKTAFEPSSSSSGSSNTVMYNDSTFHPSLNNALFLGSTWRDEDLDDDADLELETFSNIDDDDAVATNETTWRILDHDIVFWLGDLNYRIHESVDAVDCFEMAESLDLGFLIERDQLNLERSAGRVFRDFHEGAVNFPVTYKYQPGTLNELTKKNFKRPPAWCDRVLWRTLANDVRLIEYTSASTLLQSDHKPVRAVFQVQVRNIDWPSRDRALRHATLELSRLSSSPTLSLSISTIDLGPVYFGLHKKNVAVKLKLSSQKPVLWRLSSHRKSWLKVTWTSDMNILGPDNPTIELTVRAEITNAQLARRFNDGLDTIRTNLVIHEYFYEYDGEQRIPQVKDHYLHVEGKWIDSVFGARLDDLCRLPTGATLGVPPQLWRILDALFQFRTLPDLFFPAAASRVGEDIYFFRDSIATTRNNTNQQQIWLQRIVHKAPDLVEALDDFSNSKEIPVNVHPQHLAAALIAFLNALATPIIPISLLPTTDIQDPAELQAFTRDLLQRLPAANYNVFIYLCSFARQLFKDKEHNQLNPSKLASLLADACLPPEVIAVEHPQRLLILPVFTYLLTTRTL